MRCLSLLACLLIFACRPSSRAVSEEKAVRNHILAEAFEPATVRFIHWGQHDTTGRIANAVAVWKRATKRDVPEGAVVGKIDLVGDVRFVSVQFDEVDGETRRRERRSRIYRLQGDKTVLDYMHADQLAATVGLDGWVDWEVDRLSRPLER